VHQLGKTGFVLAALLVAAPSLEGQRWEVRREIAEGLSTGFRARNDAIYGNLFYSISSRLVFGVEITRWRTAWVGVPDGRVVRFEPALFYVF
jgi:hypothetical protein